MLFSIHRSLQNCLLLFGMALVAFPATYARAQIAVSGPVLPESGVCDEYRSLYSEPEIASLGDQFPAAAASLGANYYSAYNAAGSNPIVVVIFNQTISEIADPSTAGAFCWQASVNFLQGGSAATMYGTAGTCYSNSVCRALFSAPQTVVSTPTTTTGSDGTSVNLGNCALSGSSAAGTTLMLGGYICDTDTDGDGTLDPGDLCPEDPAKLTPGQCGCGASEIDTDGDGVADCTDSCADDPEKTEQGVCGCGVADTDSDGDGVPDCRDECVNDPSKTAAGTCGCNAPETDSDGDGMADCHDLCPADASVAADARLSCTCICKDLLQNDIPNTSGQKIWIIAGINDDQTCMRINRETCRNRSTGEEGTFGGCKLAYTES